MHHSAEVLALPVKGAAHIGFQGLTAGEETRFKRKFVSKEAHMPPEFLSPRGKLEHAKEEEREDVDQQRRDVQACNHAGVCPAPVVVEGRRAARDRHAHKAARKRPVGLQCKHSWRT